MTMEMISFLWECFYFGDHQGQTAASLVEPCTVSIPASLPLSEPTAPTRTQIPRRGEGTGMPPSMHMLHTAAPLLGCPERE